MSDAVTITARPAVGWKSRVTTNQNAPTATQPTSDQANHHVDIETPLQVVRIGW